VKNRRKITRARVTHGIAEIGTVRCDLRDESPAEFEKRISRFWSTKCIAGLISAIVEQPRRSGFYS